MSNLPPHTKDFGAPGHPKHWCERCRIESELTTPCTGCDGKGFQQAAFRRESCGFCDGRGYFPARTPVSEQPPALSPAPPFCSQCGQNVTASACGPTHAMRSAELDATEAERLRAASPSLQDSNT